MKLSRRALLSTATSGAALTVLGPGLRAAFGADATTDRDILIVIFLRFGSDGLTLVPPADNGDYHASRPVTGVSATGANAALPLGKLDGIPFFMHPSAPELKALYDAKSLAIVHAAGLETESRSHFVSQDKVERGIADGELPLNGGWLGRHLISRNIKQSTLSAITSGSDVDVSLQGYSGAVAIVPNLALFNITGGPINLQVIERMSVGPEPTVASAQATIETIKTVQANVAALPPDTTNAAGYTGGDLSTTLKSVATLIKANMGLEVATVDHGGWDHHNNLNNYFPGQTEELSKSIAAFWNDLKDYRSRLTIVTMTEFGRRVQENANAGLDHGSASLMLALGGNINGGNIFGQWPGLKPADLHAGDLKVTTDYRQVLQEILVKRRGEAAPEKVFPTLSYQPLGLIKNSG